MVSHLDRKSVGGSNLSGTMRIPTKYVFFWKAAGHGGPPRPEIHPGRAATMRMPTNYVFFWKAA